VAGNDPLLIHPDVWGEPNLADFASSPRYQRTSLASHLRPVGRRSLISPSGHTLSPASGEPKSPLGPCGLISPTSLNASPCAAIGGCDGTL
jgi:hypothetical protein